MRRSKDAQKALLVLWIVFSCLGMAAAQRTGGTSGGSGSRGTTSASGREAVTSRTGATLTRDVFDGGVPEPDIPTGNPALSDSRPIKFTAHSELVLVPVIVQDKQGKHVPALTRNDFMLLEDDKEQAIASFEEVRTVAGGVRRVGVAPGEFSNLIQSDGRQPRVIIIALDSLNTPFLDQTRARAALIKYLAETVQPDSLISLISINRKGVRVIHDFTSDPNILIAALRNVAGQLHQMEGSVTPPADALSHPNADIQGRPESRPPPSIDAEAQDLLFFVREADNELAKFQRAAAINATLESFQHIARAYRGIPGRKALIWATAGFPFVIDDSTALIGAGGSAALYESTLEMLNHANIAVYPVDVRGLVGMNLPDASQHYTSRQAMTSPTAAITAASAVQSSTIGTLETFASMTGGKAFYNRNDIDRSFRETTEDASAYYMLGYYLDRKKTSAGWRKLKVKVARGDVHVRSRNGFFLTRTTVDPQASREMDLRIALYSPLDYTGVPLTVRWLEDQSKGGKKHKMKFEIVLPANAASIDDTDNNRLSLEIAALVTNGSGDLAGTYSKTIQSNLKPEGVEQVRGSGLTYTDIIEVPPGEFKVRFVVRDNLNGRTGSVAAPLAVP